MTICAVVKTLRAGYDCEEELVKSLGFKVGDKFEAEYIDMGGSSTSIHLRHFLTNHSTRYSLSLRKVVRS